MVRPIALTLILMQSFSASSQEMEAHLTALNGEFGGAVRFSLSDHQELIIVHADQRGLVRQDLVPLSDIDIDRIGYSLPDDAIVIRCDSLHARCISSEQFRMGSSRRSNQALVPRPLNDAGAQRLMGSIKALAKAAQESMAETPRDRPRKN